ncbi:hypothetical protein DCAR_0519872 [Daucus carota subsp. sativus]|uniref:Uncharacterized protein n=1 Tax=Daucus carota subsp. sativus TaxID=79200 RepID=A0AAF0X4P3_DAUCS|nr:hypothetical protein DCAR_0519872 [Daucus carota subsp. sativus]
MRDGVTDVSHSKTKNCGRKRIVVDWDKFEILSLTQRKTLCDAATGFSTSLLSSNLKQRPSLMEDNKKVRLKFCLSMLDKNSLPHESKFMNMNNIVHIDEKLFNLSKTTESIF